MQKEVRNRFLVMTFSFIYLILKTVYITFGTGAAVRVYNILLNTTLKRMVFLTVWDFRKIWES